MIRLIVHEPIFVPISGSADEPIDGAGEIPGESTVGSSGEGWVSLSFDIRLLEQKNTMPSTVQAELASKAC